MRGEIPVLPMRLKLELNLTRSLLNIFNTWQFLVFSLHLSKIIFRRAFVLLEFFDRDVHFAEFLVQFVELLIRHDQRVVLTLAVFAVEFLRSDSRLLFIDTLSKLVIMGFLPRKRYKLFFFSFEVGETIFP